MENRSEELYVRIEDPKIGTNSIIGMSLAFGLGFLVCIVVGATGPPIFMTDPDSVVNMQILPGQNNTLWNGEVSGLSMYHRDLYVTALIQRPGFFDPSSVVPLNMDFSYTQDIWITITAKTRTGSVLTLANTYLKEVTVSCEASEQWCNTLLIYYDHLVEYPQFYIKAEFVMPKTVNGKKFGGVYNMIVKIAYQSPKYTVFMLGWTYFFLGVTFLVMFFPCYGFFWVMAQVKRDKWTTQQMWISGLLCTLFLYDDPFFAAELLQSGDDLAVLYVFFMATFISSILLFWLVMLDEIRIDAARDSNPPRLPKWFLPKVVLCFAIWVILLGAYISVKRHQMIDPSYDATGKKARPYYGALAAFMIFYILWILYLAISCLHHVRKMIPGYRFLFFITLTTIIVTIVGVFLIGFYPLRGAPIGLLCIFGLYNLYVWTLALAYTPNGRDHRNKLEINQIPDLSQIANIGTKSEPQHEHQQMLDETEAVEFKNIEAEV